MKFLDPYFSKYKWYRKLKKGIWYQHELTLWSVQIGLTPGNTFWARYGEINRFSTIINTEKY